LTLTALNRFPVKSCRGEALPETTVEPWGLQGDRRWMLVDDDGETVTAREHPRMLLLSPSLRHDGGLDVVAPDLPPLSLPFPPPTDLVAVTVFGRAPFLASLAGAHAHAWFSKVLGEPVRLVYADDPTRRNANPDFAGPDAAMAFQDGYPLHVTSTASLDQLNEWIAAGPRADEGNLPMIRFRPNVVVSGDLEPWAEDGWRRVRIGAAYFRSVKGCDRCAIPTTDHVSAQRFKEPTYTLAQHRRFDGAVWFGMNLVPENPGVTIRVGDEVEILASVPAPDGPPR
jgi:uncharacterized protein YcbX